MGPQLTMPAPIASDDGKLPSGRQGREGRDFLSPLKLPLYRNFHDHERRLRAYARGGINYADVFSRPSRPGDAVVGLRPVHRAGWRTHPWGWQPLATAETAEIANATPEAMKIANERAHIAKGAAA
jgi:hypothetical protein